MERTSLRHFRLGAIAVGIYMACLPGSEYLAMAAEARGDAAAGTTASLADRVHVGPSVHVSAAKSGVSHFESLVSAHAEKPYLLACSMSDVGYPPPDNVNSMACYVSFDAGRSWSEPKREISNSWIDPNMIHGLGSDVYAAAQGTLTGLIVERSDDFGKTFRKVSIVAPEGLMDRTYFGIDRGKGPSRGTLYLRGWADHCLFTSTDQGKTFVERAADCNDGSTPYNFVNFSDGSLGQLLRDALIESKPNKSRFANGQPENYPFSFVAYKDGKGEKRGKIGDQWWRGSYFVPTAAVDTTNGPFRDSVYASWMDMRSGRYEILFARSRDGGRSWSQPTIINDDRAPPRKGEGASHRGPVVAVNKNGVIAIVWYAGLDGKFGFGWQMRGVVSFDGGETFSSSFAVSEEVDNQSSLQAPFAPPAISPTGLVTRMNGFLAGHTSGLTATADGSFYAVWFDGRSGVMQLWGAKLSVDGKATINGIAVPDDYEEISSKLQMSSASSSFDKNSGILTSHVSFANTSKETLRGPFIVQISDIRNIDVVAQAVDTANGQAGRGSLWQFNVGTEDQQLLPGQTTMSFALKFKITDKDLDRDSIDGMDIKWRILGRVTKR